MTVPFIESREQILDLIGTSEESRLLASKWDNVTRRIRAEARRDSLRFLLEEWLSIVAEIFSAAKEHLSAGDSRILQEGDYVGRKPPA